MHTPVYLEMNAHDDLLLLEGLCQQLGIVSYHLKVSANPHSDKESCANSVRLSLVSTVHVNGGTFLFQPVKLNDCDGLQFDKSLIQVSNNGCIAIVLSNISGSTGKLSQGTYVGY